MCRALRFQTLHLSVKSMLCLSRILFSNTTSISLVPSPQALWPVIVRQERLRANTLVSLSRVLWLFGLGDHPLTKNPEDSGCEIGAHRDDLRRYTYSTFSGLTGRTGNYCSICTYLNFHFVFFLCTHYCTIV